MAAWKLLSTKWAAVVSFMLVSVAVPYRTVQVDDDQDNLVRFVRGEYPVLVAAPGLVCGSQSAAEDAVQEALVRAIVAQQRGRRIESLPAWLRVGALNLLRNRRRSLLRERVASRRFGDHLRTRTIGDAETESVMDIHKAVMKLSPCEREAVALHCRLGLTVADTASAMGVTDGTVGLGWISSLHRPDP